jgi:hypothetical protein
MPAMSATNDPDGVVYRLYKDGVVVATTRLPLVAWEEILAGPADHPAVKFCLQYFPCYDSLAMPTPTHLILSEPNNGSYWELVLQGSAWLDPQYLYGSWAKPGVN